MRLKIIIAMTSLVIGLASGCDPGTDISEFTCPPAGTALTYENFGQDFFLAYCVECHGGPNAYSSRAFVTVESIREQRERIFINAAADNTYMPPGPDDPDDALRQQLAEWLVCGAP